MQFLIDNQNEFIVIGVALFALAVVYGVRFAKGKNWIKPEDINNFQHGLIIGEEIVSFLKLSPEFTKNSTPIFDACRKALDYATNVMNVTDKEEQKKFVYAAVEDALKQLGVTIDERKQVMIKTGISLALAKMDDK